MESFYSLLGLIPQQSDFSLIKAVSHFSSLQFSVVVFGKVVTEPVRAYLVIGDITGRDGFEVAYGSWKIAALLYDHPEVLVDSEELARDTNLPVGADLVRSCSRRLSIQTDLDPDFDKTDLFTDYCKDLQLRFGIILYDSPGGAWWPVPSN